jgi:hypothetical protein
MSPRTQREIDPTSLRAFSRTSETTAELNLFYTSWGECMSISIYYQKTHLISTSSPSSYPLFQTLPPVCGVCH